MSFAVKSLLPRHLFWLPLLAKELTEKANRLRTYWVRAIYALVFFGYFGFEGYKLLQYAATGLAGLGTGAAFFQKIYMFQLAGTLLFIPALMSGQITYEKERASLPLLLTTDLAPWRIVLQKFLGGLTPMLAMQLTALPMTAVAYSLGGVSIEDLYYGALMLFCHTVAVGAFCLACSAFCRSSVGAFLSAYLFGAVALVVVTILTSVQVMFSFPIPAGETRELQLLLIKCSPVAVLLSLVAATRWLRTRAETSRKNRLRAFFIKLDKAFKRINDKLGGVNIIKRNYESLEDRPVRWRELNMRALSRTNYLVRICVVIEVIVVAIMLFYVSKVNHYWGHEIRELSYLYWFLWALLALVLMVQGANIVASERSGETLNVLLTTPLKGSEILRQKSVVYRRIALMALIPLGTICWTEAAMEKFSLDLRLTYGVFSLLSFLAITPLIFWLAAAIGLHVRSRFRALIVSILVLVGLVVLPILLDDDLRSTASYVSPATPLVFNELGWDNSDREGANGSTAKMLAFNLAALWILMLVIRSYCLLRADALLGRSSPHRHSG